MLYRDILLKLGDPAPAFIAALSCASRARLREEILAVYALYERHGADALRAAMTTAQHAGVCSADALTVLLAAASTPVSVLDLPGLPSQQEVDRQLAVYERWVQIDEAQGVLG
jgi:hypothetical protein